MVNQNPILLYEVDIRVVFNQLKRENPAIKSLVDIPNDWFEELKSIGVKYLWLIGIYEPSDESKRLASEDETLFPRFKESLPDWTKDDVISSPYAIKSYKISDEFGGIEAYKNFRKKLSEQFGIKIILDFVPNHSALDNPIVKEHPEYFIQAPEYLSNSEKENYYEVKINGNIYQLAHGKDPYFPSWKDTIQFDYRSLDVHNYMMNELISLSQLCDGVRCDMSMLILNDVFNNTWRNNPLPENLIPMGKEFWYDAIKKIKQIRDDFLFIAEVYWEKDKDMIDLGFDFVYDKKLYDCLIHNHCPRMRDYIGTIYSYERKRLLFLENHDETRVASVLSLERHFASAVLIYTLPAMQLIYDGQIEGRKYPHALQLKRLKEENKFYDIYNFYKNLFLAINNSAIKDGYFKFLVPLPAWETSLAHFNFIIYLYENEKLEKDLVVINFSQYHSQCKVKIESYDLINNDFEILDRLSENSYLRSGNEMFYNGLYLDLEPYQAQIFSFKKIT